MFSLDQAILLFGTFYFYGGVVFLFLPIIMKVLPETKVHIFRYFASRYFWIWQICKRQAPEVPEDQLHMITITSIFQDHCLTEIHRIFTPQQSLEDYIEKDSSSNISKESETSATKQTDVSTDGYLNWNWIDYIYDVRTDINAHQISWKQARKPQAMFWLSITSSQV